MNRLLRLVAGCVLGMLGLVALPASTAMAAETYSVTTDVGSAAFYYKLCLKTTTTMKNPPSTGKDRVCSGQQSSVIGSYTLTADYTPGDTVWMDVEMMVDLSGHSRTKDDIEITGARNCKLSGALYAGKFKCDNAINKKQFEPPDIKAYTIKVEDQNQPIVKLLNLMAWCVSAAAVLGLLITGATLASQLRRGALEERTEYMKHLAFVVAACLIATMAGPFVRWLALTG
ncbi:hypothetical protein QQG74_14220 [Micromonospora sp. FIMYZ51]|uniref:hypothetical protein n=1 Tax=Micromonospora sp. FIMYZ51 TaxID=3051832 RepID=UPI00311F44FC